MWYLRQKERTKSQHWSLKVLHMNLCLHIKWQSVYCILFVLDYIYLPCEERMASLKIHGFVQIRSKNHSKHTWTSQWKEAVIKTVEKNQKANLMFPSSGKKGEAFFFLLGGSIAGGVVIESGLHHLHVTLKEDPYSSTSYPPLILNGWSQSWNLFIHLNPSTRETEEESWYWKQQSIL